MHTLPFPQLPGMNALFLDFVDDPEKVRRFYPSRETIPQPRIPHRRELCDILKRQNEAFGNRSTAVLIEKLAKPDTLTVITGQQVSLLTGPMYTIWKALTALRFCEKIEKEKGVRCVPVFWMASEDHNWHEIMNFALLKGDFELLPFSAKEHLFLSRQPTGTVPVSHPEVRKILLRALAEIRIPEIREIYSMGTLAQAFARTLLWLLKDFPLLIVDPSDFDLKMLAAPFFGKLFEHSHTLLNLLNQQNETLRRLNYPVQVTMEEDNLPLFYINGEERQHLRRQDAVATIPLEKLSPSALLRPLFQDSLFPTLAYIGGPAEIAYFAQLHPWYEAMQIQQPWLLSRASVTLLPSVTRSFLQSRKLRPEELFIKEDNLIDALLNDKALNQMRTEIKELSESLQTRWQEVKGKAQTIDTTLRKSMETAERKMAYQLQKAEKKSFFAAKRKNYLLYQQLLKAKNVVYPGEKLQERYLNIFSFAPRLPDLIQDVYQKIDPESKGHQWIDV